MQQIELPKLRKIDPNKPKKKKILLRSVGVNLNPTSANTINSADAIN